MRNKKGFTLIELLAIIVILAIIAVITVPIILNVIDNSKKGAATASAYGYLDSIKKTYVSGLFDNNNLKIDGDYNVNSNTGGLSGIENYDVSVSGKIPSAGTLTIDSNNISGCLQFDEYKVEITDNEVTSTVKGTCGVHEIRTVTQKVDGTLSIGDMVKLGDTEAFYVVSSNSTTTVLLARYNLYVGEVYERNYDYLNNYSIPTTDPKYGLQDSSAVAYHSTPSNFVFKYVGSTSFSETEYWSGENLPKNVYSGNNNVRPYVENYVQKLNDMGVENITGRVLTYNEIANVFGCDVEHYSCANVSDDKKFVSSTSYWLAEARSGSNNTTGIYAIYGSQFIYTYAHTTTILGVRPVIEIPTDSIYVRD